MFLNVYEKCYLIGRFVLSKILFRRLSPLPRDRTWRLGGGMVGLKRDWGIFDRRGRMGSGNGVLGSKAWDNEGLGKRWRDSWG